jgi:hypothetical protein
MGDYVIAYALPKALRARRDEAIPLGDGAAPTDARAPAQELRSTTGD